MNAHAADTDYPHLDLVDLVGGASGQPLGDRAREHLARCEQCQLEVKRWHLVADGVRGLAAAAIEVDQPAWPRRTPRHTLAPSRRAMMVAASAAAALVLIVGVSTMAGLVHVHISGPGTDTALASVTGCSQLEQANGTLEQVKGGSLVVRAAGGQAVTVTMTSTTFLSMSGPLLSSINDGALVMVRGDSSDGTVQAAIVTVGQPFSAVSPPGYVPMQGTVSDASSTGFTLRTSTGAEVPVATSANTLVVVPHASPGQLQPGTEVVALGTAGPDGTLTGRAVAAISQLPSGTLHASFSVRDCSQKSVVEALGALSSAPGYSH